MKALKAVVVAGGSVGCPTNYHAEPNPATRVEAITGVSMLAITEEAAVLIRVLRQDAALWEQAGLRIVVDPTSLSLSMGLAVTPAPGDAVVDRYGARVFLSPPAAHRLGGGTLQAEITEGRSLFFIDR